MLNPRPHRPQQFAGPLDIFDIRHFMQDGLALIDHDRSGDHRQDGILGALHLDFAAQGITAADTQG